MTTWARTRLRVGINHSWSLLKDQLHSQCAYPQHYQCLSAPLPFLFVCFKCTGSKSAEIAPQRLGTIYELGQHFSSNVAWLFTVSSQSKDWFSR